jgi:hypothetical protein
MADRRHSLKRGDRLSKKQRQTTASDWKKSDKLRFMLWAKSDSDIYYNKTSDKALQNERQATWVTPLVGFADESTI